MLPKQTTPLALQINDLTVAYRDKPVLWDVDLDIPEGVLMAIVGPNGAGKTTLIKAVLGLVEPAAGKVRLFGQPLNQVRRLVGYVPQRGSIDWDFPASVLDVTMMGRYGQLGWLRRPTASDRAAALQALEKVGMIELAHRQISQLSGGQQQRVHAGEEAPRAQTRLDGRVHVVEGVHRAALEPAGQDRARHRVQRLGPPHWPAYPAGACYGALYRRDPAAGLAAARLGGRLIAADLAPLGITVDCLPLADVPAPEGDPVIGDRAYGDRAEIVAAVAAALAEGLAAGGVLPVLKHLPGHGRAACDSHRALPVVGCDRETLERTDFAAFRPLARLPLGMTAHVVYTAVDPDRPATLSPTVIAARLAAISAR